MEEFYWIALRTIPHVGNVTFRRLIDQLGSPQRVLTATEEQLATVKGISSAAITSLLQHTCHGAAEQECAQLTKAGARLITLHSPEYPELLRHLHDAPPYLYVKGTLKNLQPAIAIVGSRRASRYGLATTEKLARELARHGVTVISGLARGVDATAHGACLQEGGITVGILGNGIDVVYPRENQRLFDEMANRGAIVSEFPLGTLPLAENFPRRNRIISGMASGVLVVEAAEGSGSLITAQCALEQGRDIFAIPGSIQSATSRGSNKLIKQGALLVDSVDDILAQLSHQNLTRTMELPRPLQKGLSPREAAVLAALSTTPLHLDEIVTKCALTVGEVSAILLRFELDGIAVQLPGKQFSVL